MSGASTVVGAAAILGIPQASTFPGAVAAQFPSGGSPDQGWPTVPV